MDERSGRAIKAKFRPTRHAFRTQNHLLSILHTNR
jgi:hypothetical protein